MGQAGCGKSLVSPRVRASSPPPQSQKKFINSAANKDEKNNGDLNACTKPRDVVCWHPTIPSRCFTLIETPGFNSTNLKPSDYAILEQTAELMKNK